MTQPHAIDAPLHIADLDKAEDTPLRIPRPASDYPAMVPHTPALRAPDMAWVEGTLATMSLEEKVGQLFVSTATNVELGAAQMRDFHIGGFVFMGNGQSAQNIVNSVNALQALSKYPLWFSIDSEAGLGARVADATIFPLIMAFGAAGDPELAEQCGRITARESRALGLQVTYGPVVDVNTEPINPIIATRSYSDSAELVPAMARGYIQGARAEGVLCTFKHFPGHGAAAGDSHSSLPTITLTREELELHHIRPYKELAASGDVDLIMTAHIWFSEIDRGKPWPATLSPVFNIEILREDIGYQGIIISDAYDMLGLNLALADAGEQGAQGIETGVDVILGAANHRLPDTWRGIVNAVKSGRISTERLDESVRRVLIAKSRARLPEEKTVDPTLWRSVLDHPEHRAVVRRLCEMAFTRVFDHLDSEPVLERGQKILVLPLAGNTRIFYRFPASLFTDKLLVEFPDATILRVPLNLDEGTEAAILDAAKQVDRILVLGYDWTRISSVGQVALIKSLCGGDVPVVYTSFGSPYHINQIPEVAAFYCGYASVPDMQAVALEVLTGKREALGKLPVTL